MSDSGTSNRAAQLERLFDAVVDLPPGGRARYLDAHCPDPALRRELEALLAASDDRASGVRNVLGQLPLAPHGPSGPSPSKLSGAVLTRYQVQEKLGGGGMGVVYKALDTRLGRTVALKFLPPHLSLDAEAKARFIHEAKAASALDHVNICTVHDIDETDDGRLFIAMGYYAGETLKTRIQRGPLPVDEALGYATQLAEGLARAHEAAIVHRDVKPANVLVTDRGRLKIVDFGLAKMADVSLTAPGATMGTVMYMSPEQTHGTDVDQRTDLWSLGVVLYEMLTGERPFKGEYAQAIIYSILNEDPAPVEVLRPEVPEALSAVVRKLLQKEPAVRYQRAEDVARDLDAVRDGQAPEEAAPALAEAMPTRRTPGRRRGAFVVGAAVLLFLLFLLGRRGFQGGGEEAIRSIAVLPLENLSGDEEKAYFADGMHEALLGELAQISALRVISRTSVMQYRGGVRSIPEIARALNVDAVVEASLVDAGERVRIRVRLIQAHPEEQLRWTQVYDREMQDVLALHGDVARAIAGEIDVTLTPQEETRLATNRRVDPRAYDAYLKGRFYLYKLSPEHYETARQYFEAALAIDPGYAPAYAGIANVWTHLGLWGGVPPPEAAQNLKAAALKSLELDNTLAEPYMALAVGNYCYDWDWEASEAAFNRAFELDPNHAEARLFYGDFLLFMKRPEEAVAQMRRGLALDPLNPFSHTMLGWALFVARRYDEAVVELETALAAEPGISLALRCLWSIFYQTGRQEDALEMAQRFYRVQGSPEAAADLAEGYGAGGYAAAYRLAADRMAARAGESFIPSMRIARLYTFADDSEAALEHLEASYEERFPSMAALNVDPHWDNLHGHPRYLALLEKLNLDP